MVSFLVPILFNCRSTCLVVSTGGLVAHGLANAATSDMAFFDKDTKSRFEMEYCSNSACNYKRRGFIR